MRAANMGVYTREEFRRGMRDVGVDATSKLRALVPELREELEDPDEFKEVYEYSFAFAKEDNHKSLALESACALWKVLLGGDDASGRARWALVDEWCDFLTEKHGKAITRDTWSQALEFSRSIGPELEGYDPAGAWPYLIDEFVEHKLEGKAAAAAGGWE
jgi:DCN1-like protein 1/2